MKYLTLFALCLFGLTSLALVNQSNASSHANDQTIFLPYLHDQRTGVCVKEQNGTAIAELEMYSETDWTLHTSPSGFAGSGFLEWENGNHYVRPNSGLMTFNFQISSAGTYHFRIHNLHTHPDPTEENDIWTRLNQGTWVKTFSSEGGVWTWLTHFEYADHSQNQNPTFDLAEGIHTLEIAARSEGFAIDRILLTKNNLADMTDISIPASPVCDGWE